MIKCINCLIRTLGFGMSDNKKLWEGGATGAFKIFNWELFIKPRRWIMFGGVLLITSAMGKIAYEVYNAPKAQRAIEEKRKILELAEEIKRKRGNN